MAGSAVDGRTMAGPEVALAVLFLLVRGLDPSTASITRAASLTDCWEERTDGRNCACNEQACRAVCVVIVSTSRHTGEKCVSAVCRRGEVGWSGSLSGKLSSDFSIALFSLCSLSPACTRAVTSDTTRRSLDSDAHATSDFIRDIDHY